MAPTINIVIDDQGNVQSDFSGFSGNTCQKYEQRMRALLQAQGVSITGGVKRKSADQIASETLENASPSHGVGTWNRTTV